MDAPTYAIDACIDCLMLIANGDTSGTSRCQTPEGEAAYLADVARMSEGITWTTTDDEAHFSADPCAVCGERLAGDRVRVHGWSD